jgi:hypothetical protein
MTGNQKTIVAVLAVAVIGFVGLCAIAVFAGSLAPAPAPAPAVSVSKQVATPLLPKPTAVPVYSNGDIDDAARILKGNGFTLGTVDQRGQNECDSDTCSHYWNGLVLVSLFETDGKFEGMGVFVEVNEDVEPAATSALEILTLVVGLDDSDIECAIDAGEGMTYCGDLGVAVSFDVDGFFVSYVW